MQTPIDNDEDDSDRQRDLDGRVTVLETRFDTILPTLATKADLATLEAKFTAELHKTMSGMYKWIAGTCIMLIVGFAGLSYSINSSLQTTSSALQATSHALDQLIAAQQHNR